MPEQRVEPMTTVNKLKAASQRLTEGRAQLQDAIEAVEKLLADKFGTEVSADTVVTEWWLRFSQGRLLCFTPGGARHQLRDAPASVQMEVSRGLVSLLDAIRQASNETAHKMQDAEQRYTDFRDLLRGL